MRYLIVDGESEAARRLVKEVAEADDVLRLSEFTEAPTSELMRFDPDLILVDAESAALREAATQALVDFASFGRRALVALVHEDELERVGKPPWAQYVLAAPYTRAGLDRVARLAGFAPTPFSAFAVLRCGDLELNSEQHTVRVNGRLISLTFTEFHILHELLKRPGDVLSRRELAPATAYPHRPPARESATNVYIRRIREKLADARMFRIETVKNVGYRCVDRSDETHRRNDASVFA